MNAEDLLDAIDAAQQIPYPVYNAERDPHSFWVSQFAGWKVDEQIYPTFREAAIAMLRSDV